MTGVASSSADTATGSAHEANTSADIVAIAAVAADLLDQAREHPSRRAARTVVSGAAQRATIIALAEGAELAEHDSPPAATLQVISGRVRLHSGELEWLMGAGDLVRIPPTRHALDAITDAAVLLTVALAAEGPQPAPGPR